MGDGGSKIALCTLLAFREDPVRPVRPMRLWDPMGPWVHVMSHWGLNFSDLVEHVEPSNIHQRGRISGIGFRVNRSILKYPRFWDSPIYRRAVTRSFFCEKILATSGKQRQGISAKVGRCKKLPLRGCDSWAKMVVTCCDMSSPSIPSRPRLVRYHPCNAQT